MVATRILKTICLVNEAFCGVSVSRYRQFQHEGHAEKRLYSAQWKPGVSSGFKGAAVPTHSTNVEKSFFTALHNKI